MKYVIEHITIEGDIDKPMEFEMPPGGEVIRTYVHRGRMFTGYILTVIHPKGNDG